MAKCFECRQKLPSIRSLFAYLLASHKTLDISTYRCTEEWCGRIFKSKNSYRKHLQTIHQQPSHSNNNSNNEVSALPESGGGGLIIIKASKPELVQSPNRLPVSSVDLTALINTCAQKFVAKLYGNPRLPRNLVQKIIDDLEGFFGGCFVEIVKSEVLQTLSESSETKQNRIDEIERMFNKLENPFKDLRSEHLRFKHLENSGYYIAPVSFIIGETKAPKASFSGV